MRPDLCTWTYFCILYLHVFYMKSTQIGSGTQIRILTLDVRNQTAVLKEKLLLTDLAECFLKEYLQYFYDIFLSNI